MQISCVQPGAGARLVDQGRPGMRAAGIPAGGAADRRAADRARTILELPPEAVLLELTLSGGQWLLSGKGQVILTGADMNWRLNGRPAEAYTTLDIDGDFLLDGGFAQRGCRAYLGIRGEWEVPKILDSVSPGVPGITKIEAGWTANVATWSELDYTSDLEPYQHCPELPLKLEVIPGPEWNLLPEKAQEALLSEAYEVGKDSSRQGLRLEGQVESKPALPDLISSPVLPGTIQLTPSGPILLLNDAHTLGGFPRVLLLAENESIDAAGQLKVGDGLQLVLRK